MAEDLFEELDRFQQSIRNVYSSDELWSRHDQDNRLLNNRYDSPNAPSQQYSSDLRHWPRAIRSPTPILDALGERPTNQPEHSLSRGLFREHSSNCGTDHQPTMTLLNQKVSRLSQDRRQLDTSSRTLYSPISPPAIPRNYRPAERSHNQEYFPGSFDHIALSDRRSGPTDNVPLRTHLIKQPDQAVPSQPAQPVLLERSIRKHTQTPVIQGISLISTYELPDRIRAIFPFPLFNAVQSKCFAPVFQTNDNFVLSAPTGSGKTGVLELAICRLMTASTNESFKIIYQAPTKSLCSERQRDWQSKFRPLGLQCAELTGDTTQNQLYEVQHASIIITTPEKWDSITRKWKDRQKLMQMIKLFLIDEVHILKEERGATLEAVVSRMKSMGSDVRFIAISATIPNSQDVATWLGKSPDLAHIPAQMERFGEDFRPVKLQKHVCGYQGGANDFGFDKLLNAKLPDVISKWSQHKPLMIFCSTRRSCVETAKMLSNWWASKRPTDRFWRAPGQPLAICDKDLQGVVSSGVAFHHAGLSVDDRCAVEKSYLEGGVNVICCTSTLAIGVNLPCHMVIIKGTATYQGQVSAGCREYSDLEVMQMLGRAGRPQFDNSAVAVIMTRVQRAGDYEKMITGQEVLESSLHQNLIDHINAEIGLGTVTDPSSAKKWLTGTFLYVRLKANPKHYQLDGESRKQSVDEQLENFCAKAIGQLEENQLVVCNPNPKCTEFGDAMARYCLRFDTMKALIGLQTKPKLSEILSVISKAAEFREVRIRPGDKSIYRELNKNQSIKFPVHNSLDSSAHKISLIIQSVLGAAELPTEDSKARVDYQTCKVIIFNHINRLVRCVIDCQLHLCDSVGTRNALTLARSLGAQVWDDTPLHLKQLEGIGLIGVRKLVNANIKSIEDFQMAEAHQIERALSRNPPWGTQLQSKAATFPRLRVSLTLQGEPTVKKGQGVTIQVKVDIGFLNEKTPVSFQRKAVYVCLLVDTTAGNVVHFGRISATKLGRGQDVQISVNMTSLDQAVRAFVMCDEIAGTARQAVLKPELPVKAFLPSQVTPRRETQSRVASNEANTSKRRTSNYEDEDMRNDEFDDDQVADEDLFLFDDDGFRNIEDFDQPGMSDCEPQTDARPSKPQISVATEWQPQRLENGNWACNHSCTNKKTCKHRCCQVGLEKKPKPPKSTSLKRKGDENHPTQRRLDASMASKPASNIAAPAQPRTHTSSRKSSLQTANPGDDPPETHKTSSSFVPPRTTIYNRDVRKVIPRFNRTLTRLGGKVVETLPPSEDELEDLDFDFVSDSQTAGPRDQRRSSMVTDSQVDELECMSGALPSVEGVESVDLSDGNDMENQLLQSSFASLVNPGPGPNRAPRTVGLSDQDVTGAVMQQGLFVSDDSDSSSCFSDDEAISELGTRGEVLGENLDLPEQSNKKRKLSDDESRPCALDENDGGNDSTATTFDAADLPRDEELDLKEWFLRHFGTEHFNYIG